MPRTISLIILSLAALILTGSALALPQQERLEPDLGTERVEQLAELLEAFEDELAAYRLELQKAGEELFAQREGELRRAHSQGLKMAADALQAEAQEALEEAQSGLNRELLTLHLELLLVSLSPEEQEAKLQQLAQIQDELGKLQGHFQEQLEQDLNKLEEEYEQSWQAERAALQEQVEQTLSDEFNQYRLGLLAELEQAAGKLGPSLGSAGSKRSY